MKKKNDAVEVKTASKNKNRLAIGCMGVFVTLWLFGKMLPDTKTEVRSVPVNTAIATMQPTNQPTIVPFATNTLEISPGELLVDDLEKFTEVPEEAPTKSPSKTPAPTRTTPPQTPTLAVRRMNPQVYYSSGSSNLRSCPSTNCDITGQLSAGAEVQVIGSIEGQAVNAGNAEWYQVKHNNQTYYAYSGVLSRFAPAPVVVEQVQQPPVVQPVQVEAQPQQPVQQSSSNTVRPRNCDEAVAMGLSAVEAAQWSHLDKDKDGVACYGD